MTRSKLGRARAAENSEPLQLQFSGRVRLTEPRSEAVRRCPRCATRIRCWIAPCAADV